MELIRRWVPISVVILLALSMHWYVARQFRSWAVWAVAGLASLWMVAVVPLLMNDIMILFVTPDQLAYLVAASLAWVILMVSAVLGVYLRRAAAFNPERRRFLAMSAPIAGAVPLVAAGYGSFIASSSLELNEVTLKVNGLHRDLDGLRIAQLTDIHYGPFFGRKDLERAVAMANEARPHITVVTGDLITRWGDALEGCLEVLRGLRAGAGLYGCHGNHEEYAEVLDKASALGTIQGLRFLRGNAVALRFGNATLNLAGHDYQHMGHTHLPRAEELVRADAFNVLLQHNPTVFPRSAELGFDLMLAGHTHGGQIGVSLLRENFSVARCFSPYVRGEYEIKGKLLYVSSGLGTVGIPVRLGAPPEVTVIRLCAA